ncbi:hypothetical protein MXB_504 [Myxobolus squamalis]|nr:hypothetical protein MXB_504 [Myxobolus squamalis]
MHPIIRLGGPSIFFTMQQTIKKLGIIGCGKVGRAFIGGFKKNGKYPLDQIMVSSLLMEDRDWAHSQSCRVALPNHSPAIKTRSNCNVGTCAIARGSKCSEEDLSALRSLMLSLGYCVELPEEIFDTFTALAGSGPAFIYGVIEALAEGAVVHGIPRKDAIEITTNMVYGASSHALENLTKYHPCQLRESVCTPGGSSIQGMRALENAGFRAAFISAIDAAVKKNKELGDCDI